MECLSDPLFDHLPKQIVAVEGRVPSDESRATESQVWNTELYSVLNFLENPGREVFIYIATHEFCSLFSKLSLL